jgi:hypothetical protein
MMLLVHLLFIGATVAAELLQVTTPAGQRILGHPSGWKSNVSEFLGIRYALVPSGERRWAPPVRSEADTANIIVASQYVSLSKKNGFDEAKLSTNSADSDTVSSLKTVMHKKQIVNATDLLCVATVQPTFDRAILAMRELHEAKY